MVDISLVDTPINIDSFDSSFRFDKPCLFIGHILKNEYDNQRLQLNDDYDPVKFFITSLHDSEWTIMPLYGILRQLNNKGKQLAKLINEQRTRAGMNMIIYENLINQFDITCNDCYGYYKDNIYPIDFNKFRELTDDEISRDKKILQHLLNLDENKFDFQKFGSIISLLLV